MINELKNELELNKNIAVLLESAVIPASFHTITTERGTELE